MQWALVGFPLPRSVYVSLAPEEARSAGECAHSPFQHTHSVAAFNQWLMELVFKHHSSPAPWVGENWGAFSRLASETPSRTELRWPMATCLVKEPSAGDIYFSLFPYWSFLGSLPRYVFALESLSQGLLLGEPKIDLCLRLHSYQMAEVNRRLKSVWFQSLWVSSWCSNPFLFFKNFLNF